MSRRMWALALASLASLMVSLDILVVSTAATQIRLTLDASLESLEWTVNAYLLTFAVLLLTATAVADRFGRRRVFAAGFALFSAASALCALAPDVGWLIAGRVVQGVGAAILAPVATALVGAAFPADRRGWAFGMLSSITGLATVGGPIVGGAVTQAIGWEWVFWLNVPVGLLAVPLILTRLTESVGPRAAFDLPGLGLVSAAVLGLVWGLVRATGHDQAGVPAALAAGVLLLFAFVVRELRAPAPMLPMRLFRNRAFAAGNVASFLLFGAIIGSVFQLAQFLQNVLGYGPLDAGLRLIPSTAPLIVIAPIAGSLVDRFGARPVIVTGMSLATLGTVWLAVVAEPGMPYWAVALPLLVSGIGNCTAIPATISAVIGSVEPAEIGKAAGVNATVRQLGSVFGVAVLVLAFAGTGGYGSPESFNDGFVAAMATSATLTLCGVVAGLMVVQSTMTSHSVDRSHPMVAAEDGDRRPREETA